jgi:hypothetical protein
MVLAKGYVVSGLARTHLENQLSNGNIRDVVQVWVKA